MKRKSLFITFIIILSSFLVMGCSNGNNTSKAANKNVHKSGKAHAHKKKNARVDPKILKYLGMNLKDFRKEKKEGKSIAEMAQANNKTEQEVINLLLKDREETFKKKNPDISADKLTEKEQQWTKKIKQEVEKKKKQKKGE